MSANPSILGNWAGFSTLRTSAGKTERESPLVVHANEKAPDERPGVASSGAFDLNMPCPGRKINHPESPEEASAAAGGAAEYWAEPPVESEARRAEAGTEHHRGAFHLEAVLAGYS